MTAHHDVPTRLQAKLFADVGAFFANTSRGLGRCAVCTGPATAELCSECAGQRAEHGDQLADLVVPLAYARANLTPRHQSEHHMWQYKNRLQPSHDCQQHLKLMVRAGTLLHGLCIAAAVGSWEVLTFVPSAARPGTSHPVVGLAQAVAPFQPPATRVLLEPGPGVTAGPARWPRPDRFVVPAPYARTVAGRRVLLVDDTWVSGDKAQSAALALKAAGAAAVTVLCVARWLNYRWSPAHAALIDTLRAERYDALRCPVTTPADCSLVTSSPGSSR